MDTPAKTKPSEGKSFIRFTMGYSGISKNDVTPYAEEMMRLEFAKGIQDKGVATNQVVIQSVESTGVLAVSVNAIFRVEVLTVNIDTVKAAMEAFANGEKKYAAALKALGSPFTSVECTLDTSSYSIKKYSSMNAVVVILITLLIIFLLMFAALILFYINIRKKSASSGGRQQLHSKNSFVPAGNLDTSYSGRFEDEDDNGPKKQSRYVSDDEDDAPRRSSKKQSRYVSDDDEDDAPRRPAKKQTRYVSDEEEEEEEEEYVPRKKSKKNMKARA